VLGLGGISPFFLPTAQGTLIAPRERDWEHPLRRRILNTLERSPGIHFRELQRSLEAANGTLRHHLDILSREGSVTVVPVNGRTCYYAGAPAHIEILEGTGVEDARRAAAMLHTLADSVVLRLTILGWTSELSASRYSKLVL